MLERKKQWFLDYSEDADRLEGRQYSDGKNHMSEGQNNPVELVQKGERERSK